MLRQHQPLGRLAWVALLWLAAPAGLPAQSPVTERSLEAFARSWNRVGWSQPDDWPPERRYLRDLSDMSWQTRMTTFQQLVGDGEESVPALLEALASGDVEVQILAAQTLGYLSNVPQQRLIDLIKAETTAVPVRLYAIDALGMYGAKDLESQLGDWKPKNGDVRKHLGYVAARDGAPLDASVVQAIQQWDAQTLDSARLNEPAPDFQLQTISGKEIRLSDFRGKKNVVLVFLYGDT